MTKFWSISIALGDETASVVAGTMQWGDTQDLAVARAVADVYRQTDTRLPLRGVYSRELTREYLELVLKTMGEDEAKPSSVVQLVRGNYGGDPDNDPAFPRGVENEPA